MRLSCCKVFYFTYFVNKFPGFSRHLVSTNSINLQTYFLTVRFLVVICKNDGNSFQYKI